MKQQFAMNAGSAFGTTMQLAMDTGFYVQTAMSTIIPAVQSVTVLSQTQKLILMIIMIHTVKTVGIICMNKKEFMNTVINPVLSFTETGRVILAWSWRLMVQAGTNMSQDIFSERRMH